MEYTHARPHLLSPLQAVCILLLRVLIGDGNDLGNPSPLFARRYG
jgi:hypothetical protein